MKPISIDGSQGEGGGQILRSSLALSILTGKPFRMENIRAGRRKPGLMRQHLTCVKAAAAICNAQVDGAEINSGHLSFVPGELCSGEFRFAVGTAGSALLVFQTVLWPLLFAQGNSIVELEGGTHNSKAPTFDFIERTFLPTVRRMGAQVSLDLVRAGFYPAGQGQLIAEIEPLAALKPIEVLERGELVSRKAVAGLCNLTEKIAQRELSGVAKAMDLNLQELETRSYDDSAGSGNVLSVFLDYESINETFVAFGERGVSSEVVAKIVSRQAHRYIKAEAPVGDYLADQLLVPMVLAGSGSFRTLALSQHFQTNKDIIQKFIDLNIKTTREDRLSWLVEIET